MDLQMQATAPLLAPSAPSFDSLAPSAEQALQWAQAAKPANLVNEASDRICEGLLRMGAPYGLARLVGEEDRQVALRVFLLDNSGSTAAADGKYLDPEGPGGRMRLVPCTRWQEICHMAMQQAELNWNMGVPCEFVLLNPPARRAFATFQEGVDLVVNNPSSMQPRHEQLTALEQMLRSTRPGGATPLAERISEIHHRIMHSYPHLAARNLKAAVVVATDGLPTSNTHKDPAAEFMEALRRMTVQLPVFLVIRLMTDEDNVVGYYNAIDKEVEFPLEVMDDLASEAEEIRKAGNGWLTYSPLLHQIREGGTQVRLLDTLDERPLNPFEVRTLVQDLLMRDRGDALLPEEPVFFWRAAKARLATMPRVYDPSRQRPGLLVNVRGLRHALHVTMAARCCSIMAAGRR